MALQYVAKTYHRNQLKKEPQVSKTTCAATLGLASRSLALDLGRPPAEYLNFSLREIIRMLFMFGDGALGDSSPMECDEIKLGPVVCLKASNTNGILRDHEPYQNTSLDCFPSARR